MKNKYLISLLLLLNLIVFASESRGQKSEQTIQFKCDLISDDKKYLELYLLGAITANDLNCVKKILAKGTSPNVRYKNEKGSAAIITAADNKNPEIMKLLIQSGVELQGEDAAAALQIACSRRNLTLIEILLKAGVSANAAVENNTTALMFSAHKGYEEVVNVLLTFDSDVNSVTTFGGTALMAAADDPEIVKTLLKAGAKLEAKDEKGRTALYYAIENAHLQKLETLLEKGAEVNLKDKKDITPLMLAEHIADVKLREKVILLLQKYGAKE